MAVARVSLNPNSQNRLTIHFPDKMVLFNGTPRLVQTNFGTMGQGNFGISIGLGASFKPWPSAEGFKGDFFQHLESPQVELLLHIYPFNQKPFRNGVVSSIFDSIDTGEGMDLSPLVESFSFFVGTPLVNTSGTLTALQAVYLGGSVGDFWAPDAGLFAGWGWDLTRNRYPQIVMGVDMKL